MSEHSGDRRYTFRGCACGDAWCAGCDEKPWDTARGEGERAFRRYREARAKARR